VTFRKRFHDVITCLDDEGDEINIGAGALDGPIVVIGSPKGTAKLAEDQVAAYLDIVTAALIAAAAPS